MNVGDWRGDTWSVVEWRWGGGPRYRASVEVRRSHRFANVSKKISFRQTVGKTDRSHRTDLMQALIRERMLLDKRPIQRQHFAHSIRAHRIDARTEIASSYEIVIGFVLRSSIVRSLDGSPNHSPGLQPRMNGSTAKRMRVHDAGSRQSVRVVWNLIRRAARTPVSDLKWGGEHAAGCRLTSSACFPIRSAGRVCVRYAFPTRPGNVSMCSTHAVRLDETDGSIVPLPLSDFPLMIAFGVIP